MRGANLIPTYPSLTNDPTYKGPTAGLVIWDKYVSADIKTQLAIYNQYHLNTGRMWLNYYAFLKNPVKFKNDFKDFVARLDEACINAVLIAYDWRFIDPPPGQETTATDTWYRNPTSADFSDPAFFTRPNGGYAYQRVIVDAINEVNPQRIKIIIDICNEPDDTLHKDFLETAAAHFKTIAPSLPLTIGFAALLPGNPFVSNPDIDILSTHPYSRLKQNMQHWLDLAEQANVSGKPIILTEFGEGNSYRDDMLYLVQRFFDEGKRNGFCFFQGIIGPGGKNGKQPPFASVGGVFHHDGSVRPGAQDFVHDLQTMAAFDGVRGPFSPILIKGDISDPDYFPYEIDPLLSADLLGPLFKNWARFVPSLDNNIYQPGGTFFQFATLHESLTYLSYFANQNYLTPYSFSSQDSGAVSYHLNLIKQHNPLDPQNINYFLQNQFLVNGQYDWQKFEGVFAQAANFLDTIYTRYNLGGPSSKGIKPGAID